MSDHPIPVVVDLDDTLVRTDTLWEGARGSAGNSTA